MKVELLSYFGNDEMVANTARVSYNKVASNYTKEQNDKLIKYLAEHNHWSPFSHPQLQFRIEIPIYCERQMIKTQSGCVYNSISGRYVDFSDTYTLIEEWRCQSKSSKQGSEGLIENQDRANEIQRYTVEVCKKAYQDLIELGVAKEQARTILPLNLNTTMIWTGSLYCFIRLYKQRTKPEAQKEINTLLKEMLKELIAKTNGDFEQSLLVYNIE
jgi:thymidylate synthase (FAD)